ncbi:MAG TPA: hypothetical protein VGB32_05335, partial [Candidatus Bathyarchaeia archaeon]
MARLDTFEEAFTRFIEDFLDGQKRFKYDQYISEMVVKGSKSLVIDFTDIYSYDMDLARAILEDPESLTPTFSSVVRGRLRTRDPMFAESLNRVNVRYRNLPAATPLRRIGSDHVSRLIMVS